MRPQTIVLATPAPISHRTAEENLGLGYLATILRNQGYKVQIIDGWLEGLTPEAIAQRILDLSDVLWVGFACYRSNMERAIQTVHILKHHDSQVPIVVGGYGPTFHAEEFVKSGIDVIVRGEAEQTVLELSQYFETRNPPLETIAGVTFVQDGQRIQTPLRPLLVAIDSLPFPARDTMHLAMKRRSPIHIEDEHNANRGAKLYSQALQALQICQTNNKPHTCIMAGMNWNFTHHHLEALVSIAKKYDANIRINPIKPVEPQHMKITLPVDMYYAGFSRLFELCEPVDLSEPPIAAVTDYQHARRCPCGRTSFRIHSITPTGGVYVSPCVYLHDYKAPFDLLQHDLLEIIQSPQFKVFRQRNANPQLIDGCLDCRLLFQCGGGCTARSYLHHMHETGRKTMLARDLYCPARVKPEECFPSHHVTNTSFLKLFMREIRGRGWEGMRL